MAATIIGDALEDRRLSQLPPSPSNLPGFGGYDTQGNPVFIGKGVSDPKVLAGFIDNPPKGEWATHYTQAGDVAQRQSNIEMTRLGQERAAQNRAALLAQIERSNAEARARQQAQQKAQAEREQAIQERQLKQQARTTGRTVAKIKEQQQTKQAEELEVVKAAESMKGGEYTQSGYRKELARRTGLSQGEAVSRLRSGTAKEKGVFKKTGVSLEQERKKLKEAEVAQEDPVRKMISVKARLEPPDQLRFPIRFMGAMNSPSHLIELESLKYMTTHKSPQKMVGEYLAEKRVDLGRVPGVNVVYDIETARRKESPQTFTPIYFGSKLYEGTSEALADLSKRTKTITKEKAVKAVEAFPQIKEFMITHKPPQKKAGEYLAKKKVPEIVGEDIRIVKESIGKLPVARTIKKGYETYGKERGDETYTRFMLKELERGTTEAITDISEKTLYKDTKLFAKKRDPSYQYNLPSRVIGKTAGIGMEVGMYTVTGPVSTGLFVAPFVEKGLQGPEELSSYIKRHPFETAFATGIVGAKVIKPAYKLAGKLTATERTTRRLSLSRSITREPFVRPRATVVIKRKGKVLYELDKPTGMYILPGGAIEKGEKPIMAAQRELLEETGLRLKLKPSKVYTSVREKHYVFEADVSKLPELKLVPQRGEVQGFKWIKPKKYTGPTAGKPLGEPSSTLSKIDVRADDLYIGSRARTLPKIEKRLAKMTPIEKQKLTKEAKDWATKTFGKEKVKGISSEELVTDILLHKEKMLPRELVISPVQEQFVRAGRPAYLKKRVPKFDIKDPSTYWSKITRQKPGTFRKFQKQPPTVVGFGSRYDVPGKELAKYTGKDLVYTHATGQEIPTQLKITPLNLKTTEAKAEITFKVLKEKMKRGEKVLFFQPPTTPHAKTSEAYVGASYLKLLYKKKPSYEIGITLKRPKPIMYKYPGGKGLITTRKAQLGVEFEKGASIDSVFKEIGKKKSVYLGGKQIGIQQIAKHKQTYGQLTPKEIEKTLSEFTKLKPSQKKAFVSKLKKEGISSEYYSIGKRYVSPTKLISIPSKVTYSIVKSMSEPLKVSKVSKERKGYKAKRYKTKYKPSYTSAYKSAYLSEPLTTYKEGYKEGYGEGYKGVYKPASKAKPIKEPIIAPPFKTKGKRKTKKIKAPYEDVVIYTPDFLSRALGIRKKLTRKQMAQRLKGGGLGLREIPIFEEPIIK